jgi:hypothetical protein
MNVQLNGSSLTVALAMLAAAPATTPALAPGLCAQTVTVLPGDASVDGSRVKAGSTVYSLTVSAGGATKDLGSMTTVVAASESNGTSAWRVAHVMTSDGGNAIDTVVVAQKSIAPVTLRGVTPGGTIALDYAGTKITGEHRDPEGSTQAIAQTLSQPTFDPNALEQLLEALPLRAGYDVRVPMYTNESGMVWFNIKVAGDAAGTSEPAWNVGVTTPDGIYRYVLSKADQSAIGYVFDDGNKMKITMRRTTSGATGH